MFLVQWFLDYFEETEDGWTICMDENQLQSCFTRVKTENPKGYLHIVAFQTVPCFHETTSAYMEPTKEYKRG